jgi:hypothetical protein
MGPQGRGRWMRLTGLCLFVAVGCPERGVVTRAEVEALTAPRLERFASEADFEAYVDGLQRLRQRSGGGWSGPFGCGGEQGAADAPAEPTPGAADESVTNTQEEGVDEGGIVKAVGDYFVVLRRGRLFSVRQSEDLLRALEPVDQADAFPSEELKGSWYDEMLVYGRRIVVVGYSYQAGATELGLFNLGADGSLHHEATHFLRSYDYYSSRNYASRLVGGTLLFYLPSGLSAEDAELPALRTWVRGGKSTDWKPLLSHGDVYRPVQPTLTPTLHTVVHCSLDSPTLVCGARAVIGPPSRSFYVSREALYVWVSPSSYPGWSESAPDAGGAPQQPEDSFVYRLPLGEGPVTALRTRGSPIDQFSFSEAHSGARDELRVLLTPGGGGDGMWGPEWAAGELALLRAPLSAFSPQPRRAPEVGGHYARLPSPGTGVLQNRFVGEHLLWGAGSGWGNGSAEERRVFVAPVDAPAQVREVALAHAVDRLEVLGAGAAVIGSDGADLHFSALSLAGEPALRGHHVQASATQGETRSHGFFFKPDGAGGGVLGLPLRHQGGAWQHLRYGSAEVLYLGVDAQLNLTRLGALAADEDTRDDGCQASCVDWYGNARPLFYRGRIFALLGYELVEGQLQEGVLQERFRTHFLLDAG